MTNNEIIQLFEAKKSEAAVLTIVVAFPDLGRLELVTQMDEDPLQALNALTATGGIPVGFAGLTGGVNNLTEIYGAFEETDTNLKLLRLALSKLHEVLEKHGYAKVKLSSN